MPLANQKQDDITLISKKLAYRTDDHGDGILSPTFLAVDATGAITASKSRDRSETT